MTTLKTYKIHPSASRLIGSLRDIGYEFTTAVADLVDNSIAAGATHVQISIKHNDEQPLVMISDDGAGMTEAAINEALRFGSQRVYGSDDLGRYGLGLKTASLSQCRRFTVLSRKAARNRRIHARQLDLSRIEKTDRWEVIDPRRVGNVARAEELLYQGPGTVVLWEDLDRVIGSTDPGGGWAKRRLAKQGPQLEAYLGMVFHRFLTGDVPGDQVLHISINGEKVRPWDPLAPDETTTPLLPLRWEVPTSAGVQEVHLNRAVLPPRERFSSSDEFERMAGPLKWNRQQGLYLYRSNRLIQGGGWAGIRTIDEHTKLARASLDFPSALDELFHVNVAKMKVSVPPEIRTMLEGPVHELCREADAIYRSESAQEMSGESGTVPRRTGKTVEGAALAVRAAAMVAGVTPDQIRIIETHLRAHNPDVATHIGF